MSHYKFKENILDKAVCSFDGRCRFVSKEQNNMSCRLVQNIKHTCGYNSGGIAEIYLLDITDFAAYYFKDDALYDSCFVDRILKDVDTPYTTLSEVSESNFTETNDGALYRQQLTTFVNTIKSDKTNNLLKAVGNKYLVVFRNMQGNIYSFGSDGGATLAFSQVSGQLGETAGYSITLSKDSIYPLFEVNAEKFNKIFALGTESRRVIVTENGKFAILI